MSKKNAQKLMMILNSSQYFQKVMGLGPIAYWPLWDASGTVVTDIMATHNGTYGTPVSLASASSPVNKLCPTWSGSSGGITGPSSINSAFSGAEGAVMLWLNPTVASYTDSANHRFIRIIVDGSNHITQIFGATNNFISNTCLFGGTSHSIVGAYFVRNTWFHSLVTWSASQSKFRWYVNSGEIRADDTTLGTWTGTPTIKFGTSDSFYFLGNMSDIAIFDRYVTFTEAQQLCDYSGITRRLTVLGDSISTMITTEGWTTYVCGQYTDFSLGMNNRAGAGETIISNMDTQTAEAANDNADIIIIALGADDNNAGNMTTLQTTYENDVVALKASNPRATIYAMNVLPQWEDNTTGAEVDKSNIRTAIAAACTSQGITCWDTYTSPWIAQNETSDGVHPTAAGHAAIAAEVLARL